ncbi:MAG: hypothetical protein KA151_15040 [Piscinibacter sp.]|nr:hypothetical protein [Piscinibacter sp.]
MIRALWLRLRLRWVRGDIAYAEALIAHAEQQRRQIAAWQRDEAALRCELALLPRPQWGSIALASGIGASLALVLAYGPV